MKKIIPFLFIAAAVFQGCSKSDSTNTAVSPVATSGQGGSLARFTIAQQHLYIVDQQKLYTYSLASSLHPQLKSTVTLGEQIETIYPFRDKLFIGSQNAMYVYSIADADLPEKLGTASHIRSCDPVVANDTMAYITVRSGSNCGGNVNALIMYDIRNVLQPRALNTVALSSPWGLGLQDNRLYVCNGTSGLNVYDVTNAAYPALLKKITNEAFYDVIVTPDRLLICMIAGGTAVYQLKSGDELELLARITH